MPVHFRQVHYNMSYLPDNTSFYYREDPLQNHHDPQAAGSDLQSCRPVTIRQDPIPVFHHGIQAYSQYEYSLLSVPLPTAPGKSHRLCKEHPGSIPEGKSHMSDIPSLLSSYTFSLYIRHESPEEGGFHMVLQAYGSVQGIPMSPVHLRNWRVPVLLGHMQMHPNGLSSLRNLPVFLWFHGKVPNLF